MNLVLIGYRGTGKSSVGRIVAEKLGRRFIDVDVYVEENEGKTIKEIFAQDGEAGFREIEATAIKELCGQDNMVIATGGGAVLREENITNLKRNSFVSLLEADAEIINKRLNQDTERFSQRPNLTSETPFDEIKKLMEFRKPLYHKTADFVIDSSFLGIEEISKQVLTAFKEKN